jgi:hypothetical protein
MEIKSIDKNQTDYTSPTPKADNKNGTSFSETLDEVSKSYINIKKNILKGLKTNYPAIDDLPREKRADAFDGIGKLDEIFGIDILGDPDQFLRTDGTINMPRILAEYGPDAVPFDENKLSKGINELYDCGLITTEDYFYTLKWIATQKEAARVKMNTEKIAGTLVERHNDNINNLNKNKLII